MLKALELFGFKSFADRTRFDFPDGITVVVGPNGSGKSNIVDGIKWVLGSQSAKSLRGKEMADVIFKGSNDRKPAGAAEASIVFDNSSGELPYEADEVHVTRRVYRSGESEYLINGTPCRLKDVRDLVRGTGIGIDAYSLIEQGKVDRMLQANPKDRRAIFEEAAGISRFKAKKVEAARRLARAEQNLTRLGDIVDEVATRLQSLKSQASKAEKYRQATERLRECRTQLAWADWSELSELLDAAAEQAEERAAAHRAAEAEQEAAVERRRAMELGLQEAASQAQKIESARSDLWRRIASLSGTRDADAQAAEDMRRQIASGRRRVRLLQSQAGSAIAELRDLRRRHAESAAELEAARQQADDAEAARVAASSEVERVRAQREQMQSEHLEALRRAADLEGTLQRHQQRIDASHRSSESVDERIARATAALEEAEAQVQSASLAIERLDATIHEHAAAIDEGEAELSDHRRVLQRRRDEAAAFRVKLQGVSERLALLEDLSRRQEGIASGVRGLLEAAQDSPTGPLADVVALVADAFETDVHVAPSIDVALGPLAQYLIVRGDSLQRAILAGDLGLEGRIGLLRIDELPTRRPGDRIRLDGLKGVVGRADRLVRVRPELEPLARHLLGTTWLVDTLQTALGLRKLSGAGLRFVTGGCELLERDGSIMLGPAAAASGLVSRRSELLASQKEQQHYRYQLQENEREIERIAEIVDSLAAAQGRLERRHRSSVTERAGAEATREAAVEREQSRRAALEDLVQQREEIETTRQEAAELLQSVSGQLTQCQQRIAELDEQSQLVGRSLAAAQAELRRATDAVMQKNVELARIEQRAEAFQTTLEQQQRDQSQRNAAVADVRDALAENEARLTSIERRMLSSTSELAELYLESEQVEARLRVLAGEVGSLREQQRQLQRENDAIQRRVQKAAEAVHQLQRQRDEAQLRRTTLAERVREDYDIDLHAEQPPEDFEPPEDREAAEAEIASLRAQLQKTGAVNMEALEELQELQERYDELHGQYQDLTAAKESLERIIQRINADSRRLFLDTLEAIRANFQKLYRKSFGGGSADLILEESADPLEAGVEIVATPPGKPSFSNSLLSGGEKALTAVALLMAIFQYRPSPFCVLDEVDAPFDEANIGRFVAVLTEFLDHTKFVVVTHSKKTMTAATTLYGVTMQESGVSKQVSVRFEDVSDDGHIRDRTVA
ncbi:chromosome segregation protein SMC [Candidatus Laterigemmans baculatus]|uniref:chromosome segregation protein SMC n=1 Tax=Candidatus Laterigemmans baculatus TaxID=2770505 RepID=UPI0013D94DAC|nr:chromosome segregation protein SMC [Candidatus Laterigemmans baculatus]